MQEIGMFEAKTRLSEIAAQVKRTGQPVTLTNRGEPFVDLVPHQPVKKRRRSWEEITADLVEMHKTLPKVSAGEISDAIAEGRR